MKPDRRFLDQPPDFWANVRLISEKAGYTRHGTGQIKVPTLADAIQTLKKLQLNTHHISKHGRKPTQFGKRLLAYLKRRAETLNREVEPRLMDVHRAKTLFGHHKRRLHPACPIPMNKQKAEKKAPAYLTGLVNMIIEANAQGFDCDYDPRELTTITANGTPLRTLARRLDGAFPSAVNPVAVWEIKEYYYTTTFGSRVADGVYESLLDGMELKEVRDTQAIDIKHYLVLDGHYTWWECGRSYLCRIFDMLHMGYVDEVLFGHEVVERLPALVRQWARMVQTRSSQGQP